MTNLPIRQVDPEFYIPEELVGFEYAEDETGDPDFETGVSEGTGSGDDDENELQPPANITIVSQTIRKNKAGNEVVDVVIEINDKGKSGLTYDVKTAVETLDPEDYTEVQGVEV